MSKIISIRINNDEEELLNAYQKFLSKYFEGIEIDTSKAIKRALYVSANYDPLINKTTE